MIICHLVRKLTRHLEPIAADQPFILGVTDLGRFQARLTQLGFSHPLIAGERLLPSASLGRSAAINAEGWTEIHRDRPKETAYRTIIWRWQMRRGHGYEEASKPVDVPYRRYPRTLHSPFGMELALLPTAEGALIAALPTLTKGRTPELQVITAINLLVEIFGECEVLTENLERFIAAPIRHLNWQVLPLGELPWARLEPHLRRATAHKPGRTREIFAHRFSLLNSFRPDFCAVGRHGFNGYVVFGFPGRNFFLLESIHFGNATYVLGNDWERVSQLTKAEILDRGLHQGRVLHTSEWDQQVRRLFPRAGAA